MTTSLEKIMMVVALLCRCGRVCRPKEDTLWTLDAFDHEEFPWFDGCFYFRVCGLH
jgi:hypothetical protein